MKENDEQGWVERAKQGEPAGVAELYHRYWRAARATAYGVTGDLAEAEDAASEAFYAALDNLHELRDSQRFGPWLRTIVLRTARRHKTAKPKTGCAELDKQPSNQTASLSERLERQELVALIHEMIASLSAMLREAVSLFYFEGYSLKEAARFLDVPEGTLKRRLHEGRQCLREAAERILEGRRPMNQQREQILQQLKDTFNEGPDSETFYQAMRQALQLRPVPNELLREIMQKRWAAKHTTIHVPAEKEHKLREALGQIYAPSARVRDPNHPVGAVAAAIRAQLPEFQLWQADWSQVDISEMVRNISEGNEKALSLLRPPAFTEGFEGSYVCSMRAFLLQVEDGSVCTPYELFQKTRTMEGLKTQIKQGKRLSDTLNLLWKKAESIELRTVEELLRRLSQVITPNVSVQFHSCDEPRYRTALRMELADNPIPAAIGGVHNPWPGLAEGMSVASILIYLEPWASAQSGQTVELTDFSLFDFLGKEKQ